MTRNELLGQLKRGNFNMLKQFPGLSSDEQLMLEAYELNNGIVDYIDKSLMNSENFFYELALINPEIIKGTEYAGKKDFMRRLAGKAPESVKFMQSRLYEDPVFVVELVSAGAESAVLNKMKEDPEIKNRLQKLPFGEYLYVDNYEVSRQKEMIARGEITEDLSNNVEFMKIAIDKDIGYIEKMGDKLAADRNSFNEVYRANREKFDEYMENKSKEVMKSNASDEEVNRDLNKAIKDSKEKKNRSQKISHLEEKNNSSQIIEATIMAQEDDCVDELVADWERKLEEKSKEAMDPTDPEKARKAKLAASGLTKKILDAKEKIQTKDGRERLLKENENDTSLRRIQKAKEIRENAALPRAGIIDMDEVLKVLNNQNASVKTIDDKFTKAFKGITGRIDEYRYRTGEKKVSNHLKYLIDYPEEIDKWVTDLRDKKLLLEFIKTRNVAAEREANREENPSTVDGNYRAEIRDEMKKVSTSALKEEEENLEQQMKFAASEEEKKQIGQKLKGIKTKIKNIQNGKNLDSTVKDIIRRTGNKELQDLVTKDINATVVIVAEKIKNGEPVSEQELRKSANDSNKYFEEECSELYKQVKEKMVAVNPGNKDKPVLEYLIKNIELLEELTQEGSEERLNAGRWLKPAKVLQDAIEGNKRDVETKENENTREEEK